MNKYDIQDALNHNANLRIDRLRLLRKAIYQKDIEYKTECGRVLAGLFIERFNLERLLAELDVSK